jgi:intracellular sulfur oxidation DsrE/DsrF family protein
MVSMKSSPENEVDWKRTLQNAVNLAAENPDVFAAEVAVVAKRLGTTATEVYRRINSDPEIVKSQTGRSLRNSVIQGLAKRLKRDLGL